MKIWSKQKLFREQRLVFAGGETPQGHEVVSAPKQGPQAAPAISKPLAAQTSMERKFTAEHLFKQYDDSQEQAVRRTIIADLKQLATLEGKDVKGVFTLSMLEARAWFEKNNLLPSARDRVDQHLAATESQLRGAFNQSTINAIRLIKKVVDTERYQRTVASLIEHHGQSISQAMETAAKAIRQHQKMRNTIAVHPRLQQQFVQELAQYRHRATRPSWSEEYQILNKYYQLTKNETTTQSPESKDILVTLGKLDRFIGRAGEPKVLHNSVEGRWISGAATRKVARAFFTNGGKLSPKYAAYLRRALNTSHNSRIITMQVFISEAQSIGDPSLVSALLVRAEGLKTQGLQAIENHLAGKMSAEEVKYFYQNFRGAKYLAYTLSSDGGGIASSMLEKGVPISKGKMKSVLQVLNAFPQIKEHLASTYLSAEEAKNFRAGAGDLSAMYFKIASGFSNAQNSSGMPKLLALVKDNAIAIESTNVMASTLGGVSNQIANLQKAQRAQTPRV